MRRSKLGLAILTTAACAGAAPAVAAAAPVFTTSGNRTTKTYSYTGASQSFTVPANVTALSITAVGGAGGAGEPAGTSGAAGGLGASATVTVAVTPGATYAVDVGGAGSAPNSTQAGTAETPGGWNGGGAGGEGAGGSGGGTSDVCHAPLAMTVQASTCLVVAAGGGGAGNLGTGAGAGGNAGQAGGNGGGGPGGGGGQPGTDSAGGAAGTAPSQAPPTPQPGEFLNGGAGGQGLGGGGGGGGGLYGGGGGGGGASQFSPTFELGSGGGGGGGGSYAPGGTVALSASGQGAEVQITYTPVSSTTTGGGGSGTTKPTSGPSRSQVKALLSKATAVPKQSVRLPSLVKAGGTDVLVKVPSAGRIAVVWYLKRGHTRTRIASGTLTVSRVRSETLKIRLNALGKKRLKSAKTATLTIQASFTPSHASTTTKAKTITLRR